MPLEESAHDWEAEIGTLLDDLAQVQDELLTVLRDKRAQLATVDLPGLAETQVREEQLATRLKDCQRRRAELLAAARQQGLPADSMGKLASTAGRGKQAKLRTQVKTAGVNMRLLQHESLANWVLSPAVAAACFAAPRDYRHRRPVAADIWRRGIRARPRCARQSRGVAGPDAMRSGHDALRLDTNRQQLAPGGAARPAGHGQQHCQRQHAGLHPRAVGAHACPHAVLWRLAAGTRGAGSIRSSKSPTASWKSGCGGRPATCRTVRPSRTPMSSSNR